MDLFLVIPKQLAVLEFPAVALDATEEFVQPHDDRHVGEVLKQAGEAIHRIALGLAACQDRMNDQLQAVLLQESRHIILEHVGAERHEGSCAIVDDENGILWSCHDRSEEHTSELQSLMSISYDVLC